jgi:acyl-CoA thioester hydrolase
MPDPTHRLPVRIYYEDTDFSGRVYHASYLRFFERGRTEFLRACGLQHDRLAATSGVAFAVTDLQMSFAAPAFIDDMLEVVTELEEPRRATLKFRQTILRGDAALVSGVVSVVAIRDNRAIRPPRELLEALGNFTRR